MHSCRRNISKLLHLFKGKHSIVCGHNKITFLKLRKLLISLNSPLAYCLMKGKLFSIFILMFIIMCAISMHNTCGSKNAVILYTSDRGNS